MKKQTRQTKQTSAPTASLPPGYEPVRVRQGQFVTLRPGDSVQGVLLGKHKVTIKGQEDERWALLEKGTQELILLPSFVNLDAALSRVQSEHGDGAEVAIVHAGFRKANVPGGRVADFLVGVKPKQ
jgi:hypothetical protein